MPYRAVQCSTEQYKQFGTVQYSTVKYSEVQYTTVYNSAVKYGAVVLFGAVQYSVG